VTLKLQQAVVPLIRRTGNDQVDAAFRELSPFMERVAQIATPSVELPGIALVAGTNRIRHNLGRNIKRWLIIDRDSPANVYRIPVTIGSADPKQEIWLVSSATGIITLELW
jgi:hypothetical protein